jgi:hypothetical protein
MAERRSILAPPPLDVSLPDGPQDTKGFWVMTPRCHACDRPLSPVAQFDGWCDTCAGRVLAELLAMADLRPGEVATIAEILILAGATTMGRVITRAPFETAFDGRTIRDL